MSKKNNTAQYTLTFDKGDLGVYAKVLNEDGTMNSVFLTKSCSVISNYENIETGEEEVEICFIPVGKTTDYKVLRLNAKYFSSERNIDFLSQYGFYMNANEKKALIEFFNEERNLAQRVFQHKQLGFYTEQDGTPYFKHYKTIGYSKDSWYIGSFNIEPTGSYETWRDMIQHEVLPNPALQLGLILGFLAPLVGFVGKELSLESQFYHIYGDSSSGKSTVCQLIASTFGSSNMQSNGLFRSWFSTESAVYCLLGANCGIPVVFDEASLTGKKDFTNLVYGLSQGKDKLRVNANLELRETSSFLTTIISNGEYSLLEKTDNVTGPKARLIEFADIQWTIDAGQSNRIKKCTMDNYGHAGIKFVEYLLSLGKPLVMELIHEEIQRLSLVLPKSQISERLIQKFALFTTTMKLTSEALELNFMEDGVEKLFLEQIIVNNNESDLAVKAFYAINQFIIGHLDKFDLKFKAISGSGWEYEKAQGSCYGQLIYSDTTKQCLKEVIISTHLINQHLEQTCRFHSGTYVMRHFKDRGWLSCEQDKTYRKRKIQGNQIPVYVINVSKVYEFLGIEEDCNLKIQRPQHRENIELGNTGTHVPLEEIGA